jgi:hypothetical protein
MRSPEAPMGWPKHFSPPSGWQGTFPLRSKKPFRMSSMAFPRGEISRSSYTVSSVMEKQSWTSIMLISSRGFLIPASLKAICPARKVVSRWAPSQLVNMASSPEETEMAKAFTRTGSVFFNDRAISGVVTMAAADPSLTPQQSKRPRG